VIAFLGLWRENATMVQHGLMTEQDTVPVIDLGDPVRSSRYVPVTLPRTGDIDVQIARVIKATQNATETVDQFVLMLGDDVARIIPDFTAGTSGEVTVRMDAETLASELERIEKSEQAARGNSTFTDEGPCYDVVIGYRLYGRPLAGRWREYLHGPLTFLCQDASTGDSTDSGRVVSRAGPESPKAAGPFDTGGPFGGQFMSNEDSELA
jgi:hypothetical protein